MPEELRKTKLFEPSIRRHLVRRGRLIDRLERDSKSGIRLILVSAPAGFGKSTLVSEWARSSGLPTAWLSLDEGDNDPVRFWRYLFAALRTADPSIGSRLEAPLASLVPPPIPNVVTELINDLLEVGAEMLLVLEDFHLIGNPEVQASLDSFLQGLPPQLHLVVTTRSDPPLRLAHYRSLGWMSEIRAEDLRFTPAEASSFVRLMDLDLPPEDIQSLQERTEGWIAGLQMAGLSLIGETDRHGFVQAFHGDDRDVADYLIEEVLQHQSAEIQGFLLQTSILDQLCAPLCDAVLGRESSEEMLRALERANLFIFPLDNRREWYRYHSLFSDLLRRRLVQGESQEKVDSLQARALAWLEGHRPVAEAVDYALRCLNFVSAADLMMANASSFFSGSDLNTMLKLAAQLPAELVPERLPLCCSLVWASHATGHPRLAEDYIRLIERRAAKSIDQFVANIEDSALEPIVRAALLEAAVAQARIAADRFEFAYTVRLVERLLPYLVPERDREPFAYTLPSALRGPALFILGLTRKLHGDVTSSTALLSDSIEEARRVGNPHIIALACGHLGEAQAHQGHLLEAQRTWSQALEVPEDVLRTSAFFGMSRIGLGNLALEWNDLETAEAELRAGLEQGRLWNSWECLLPGYLGLARLRAASGNWQAALAAIDDLAASTAENEVIIAPSADSHRALVQLRSGDLTAATRWAEHFMTEGPSDYVLAWEEGALVVCRIWLGQGRMEECKALLLRLLTGSREAGRTAHWLEATCLESLRLDAMHDEERALGTLQSALEVAQPEGYLRLFVDEGQGMRQLLQRLAVRAVVPEALGRYIRRILQAYSTPTALRDLPDGLVENLTDRELEVLRHMAQGLSNPQIARLLYISPNTLKAHSQRIFAKLDVHNRLQAVSKAKRLGLIDEH